MDRTTPVFFCFGRRTLSTALAALIAVFLFQTAVQAQGDDDSPNAVAIFNEAQDAHEKGDLAAAIKLYDKAIAMLPEFPEAEYQRGIAELALGNNAEAEHSFRRAIELREEWTLPMTSLGSLLVQKGEMAEAERLLVKVIELEPQNSSALSALAELRRKTNASHESLTDVLAKITALTAKANPTAALWSARADLEIALGKQTAAKTSVAKSLAIDPKYRPALLQAGGLAVIDGDIDRAKQIAFKLESLMPDSDAVKLLHANISAAEGDLDEAIKRLDAIKTPGTEANDLRIRINTARTTSAAELEKQLKTNANDAAILGRLCSLYRKDDPAKALAFCRKASEAEPNNINHAVGFGAALVQAKQFDAAAQLFRKLLTIAPDNATARANLATALFQLKRYPEAKIEFRWLTESQPRSAAAYFFLAIVHDQLTEYMDAMANYQQYLKLADPVDNKLDIEKVNLRIPGLQKQIKNGKGKKK